MEERTDNDIEGVSEEPSGRPDLEQSVPEVVSSSPSVETPPAKESTVAAPAQDVEQQSISEDIPAEETPAVPAEETPTEPAGEAPADSVEEVPTDPAEETDATSETGVADADAATEAETPEDDAADASDTEVMPRAESAAAAGIDDTPGAPVAKGRVPWWPFIVYLVAWIALIGASFYLISYELEAIPAFQQDEYPYILLGGLVLTVLGPLLALTVWFVTWLRTPKGQRGGLLTSALLKGAFFTCFGVLAWWGAIAVLDALRLGMIGPIS